MALPYTGGLSATAKSGAESRAREISMLIALFVVLLIMWMLGFFAFHVAGAFIHILLLFALIALVVHLFRGSTA
jgi:hypothetical protein